MYKITWLEDSTDCETCGCNFASGYVIEKDGEVVVDKTPVATCFGDLDYSNQSAYVDILKLEGIQFEEDASYGSCLADDNEDE